VVATVTRLGRTSKTMSRLAFGCEQLGGYEWGVVDPAEIVAALELAIDSGVTLFDTADCYGRGESERRLGRALAPYRDRVILATKFGVRFTASGSIWYDSSPDWAEQALDESLMRLGTDVIDLLQMHYWDGVTPLTELFDRLEALRLRQKIRWYGISNHLPEGITKAHYPGFVSVSLEYSLVERAQERALRQFATAGVTFLAYGCLGQGILSGKYSESDRFGAEDRRSRPQYRNFHGERLVRNCRIVEVVKRQALALGVSASELAIAWVLNAVPDSVALVGIKNVKQLKDAIAALQLQLPTDVLRALDAASLAPRLDEVVVAP